MSENNKKKLSLPFHYNSPVMLTFALISLIAYGLNLLSHGESNLLLFSVYRSSLTNPLTYVRLFTHIFGHVSFEHYLSNFTVILLVGPMLEEKYGYKDMIGMILVTACVTGIINSIFFPDVRLLGASGIAFMLILLSSFTNSKSKKIPLTLVFVALIYLGNEIISGLFANDDISQLGHIIGGVCGCIFGALQTKMKEE